MEGYAAVLAACTTCLVAAFIQRDGVVDRLAPHHVAAGTVGGNPGLAVAPSRRARLQHAAKRLEVAPPLQRSAGNDVLFKMRNDPRVTRVGRFLRRYSIDELPRLLNVVRGDMSLIDPRPALYEETERYDRGARRRTAVKPGITGLRQVNGRSDLSWEKSIALDLHYVDNWRLVADDLGIAARTLGAVLGKKGAY